MEVSIHAPNFYVREHLSSLLPSCPDEEIAIVVVLQRASLPLTESLPGVQEEKDRLRDNFIRLAQRLAAQLEEDGYFIDGFDPRTGYPLRSPSGTLSHNDVAAAQTALGYDVRGGECSALIHPTWGTAVYPTVLISTAPIEELVVVLNRFVAKVSGSYLEMH